MSKFIVNAFQVPNAVHDEVMPVISDVALRCYLTIIRQTIGWQKEKDKISISQFMKKTGRSRHSVIRGVDELVKLGLIKKELVSSPNGKMAEYSVNLEISQCQLFTSAKNAPVPKVHMSSAKSDTSLVPKMHTQKDTITKDTITKDNSIEPYGSNTLTFFNFNNVKSIYSELKENGKKRKHYAHKDIAEAYNEVVIKSGKNLPLVVNTHKLSDKRMRNIRTLVNEFERRFGEDGAKVENLKGYFQSFIDKAPDFYFGDRGWKADFDYLLRITTLDKVIEGGL